MSDLRNLNSAVQNATFPSAEFAQAVRDWISIATERMEPAKDGCWLGDSCPDCHPAEPAKVECPNCGEMTSKDHTGNFFLPWTCTRQEPAQPVEMPDEGPDEIDDALRMFTRIVEPGDDPPTNEEILKVSDALEFWACAQASQPVKLEKVREFLDLMGLYYRITDPSLPQKAHTQGSAWQAALAELDAVEGRK